jgi:hypothetical protein
VFQHFNEGRTRLPPQQQAKHLLPVRTEWPAEFDHSPAHTGVKADAHQIAELGCGEGGRGECVRLSFRHRFPRLACPRLPPQDGTELIIHDGVQAHRQPVAGIPPRLQVGERQRNPGRESRPLVGGNVPPPDQI